MSKRKKLVLSHNKKQRIVDPQNESEIVKTNKNKRRVVERAEVTEAEVDNQVAGPSTRSSPGSKPSSVGVKKPTKGKRAPQANRNKRQVLKTDKTQAVLDNEVPGPSNASKSLKTSSASIKKSTKIKRMGASKANRNVKEVINQDQIELPEAVVDNEVPGPSNASKSLTPSSVSVKKSTKLKRKGGPKANRNVKEVINQDQIELPEVVVDNEVERPSTSNAQISKPSDGTGVKNTLTVKKRKRVSQPKANKCEANSTDETEEQNTAIVVADNQVPGPSHDPTASKRTSVKTNNPAKKRRRQTYPQDKEGRMLRPSKQENDNEVAKPLTRTSQVSKPKSVVTKSMNGKRVSLPRRKASGGGGRMQRWSNQSEPPGGLPVICVMSLRECSVKGGRKLVVLGENFYSDGLMMFFEERNQHGRKLWQSTVKPKVLSSGGKNHVISCIVPPYRNQNVRESVECKMTVRSNGKRTFPEVFIYSPDPINIQAGNINEGEERGVQEPGEEANVSNPVASENDSQTNED